MLFPVHRIRASVSDQNLTQGRIRWNILLPNCSSIFVILGKGYASPIDFYLESDSIWPFAIFYFLLNSVFSERLTGELYGESEALMISLSSSSFTCLLISSLWIGGICMFRVYRLIIWLIILCAVTSVCLNGSSGNRKSPSLLIILSTWFTSSLLRWSKRRSSCTALIRALGTWPLLTTLTATKCTPLTRRLDFAGRCSILSIFSNSTSAASIHLSPMYTGIIGS